MGEDLWKLKKTTDKKCPDCGKPLQIRERGGKEIISCSFCGYSENLKPKRTRRKEDDE
jgi:DNA-directed RNA polymerase subunit M/transcription elongation factor TFIIS